MILHDIRCIACEREQRNVQIREGQFPRCRCGGETTWIPRRINTDMGSGFYCEATGMTHSRHRDAELEVAKQARAWSEKTGIRWTPEATGDKVRGARNENRKVAAAFGYSGQTMRRSRGERSEEYSAPAPQTQRVVESGAKRITREDATRIKRSPVYRD